MKRIFAFLSVILTIAFTVTLCSCETFGFKKTITGDYNVLPRNFELIEGGIYSLTIAEMSFDNYKGHIEIDDSLSDVFTIATDDNIFSSLAVEVDNTEMTITISGSNGAKYQPTDFTLTMGNGVKELNIEGGYEVLMNQKNVKNSEFKIDGSISGLVTLENVETVTLEVNGAADLELAGNGETVAATVNGAAKLHSYDFICVQANLILSGSSEVTVNASDTLNVQVDGTAVVRYKGDPQINKTIRGLGEVLKAE